jgi:hypothetical protein
LQGEERHAELESIFETDSETQERTPKAVEDQSSFKNAYSNFINDERSVKTLVLLSKLQLIIAKLCLCLDGVLARERITMTL